MRAAPRGERILFLTGKLAEKSLRRVLESMAPAPFEWQVRELGPERRGADDGGHDRAAPARGARHRPDRGARTLPRRPRSRSASRLGRARDARARGTGGPAEVLRPGSARRAISVRYEAKLFVEIVDAPQLSVEGIETRALELAAQGADVIDLGCLPATPFPHLEEAVAHLKSLGLAVSVDSLEPEELLRGGTGGCRLPAQPARGHALDRRRGGRDADPHSRRAGRPRLAGARHGRARSRRPPLSGRSDPRPDPLRLRRFASRATTRCAGRVPMRVIMMGIGNVTELTHADTMGMNALLFGIVSELRIDAVLVVQVSEHARSVVREADIARRIMFAAREESALPKDISGALMALHEKRPFAQSTSDIADLAAGGARPELPDHGCARMACTPSIATDTRSRRILSRSGRCSGGGRCRPRVLSGRGTRAGAGGLAAGQALRAGRGTALGCRRGAAHADDLLEQKAAGTTLAHRRRNA